MYLPVEFFVVLCIFISLFLLGQFYQNKCMRCRKRGLLGYRDAYWDSRDGEKMMHQGRICGRCREELESEGGATMWKMEKL